MDIVGVVAAVKGVVRGAVHHRDLPSAALEGADALKRLQPFQGGRTVRGQILGVAPRDLSDGLRGGRLSPGDPGIVVTQDDDRFYVLEQTEHLGRPGVVAENVTADPDLIGAGPPDLTQDRPQREHVGVNVAQHGDKHGGSLRSRHQPADASLSMGTSTCSNARIAIRFSR